MSVPIIHDAPLLTRLQALRERFSRRRWRRGVPDDVQGLSLFEFAARHLDFPQDRDPAGKQKRPIMRVD